MNISKYIMFALMIVSSVRASNLASLKKRFMGSREYAEQQSKDFQKSIKAEGSRSSYFRTSDAVTQWVNQAVNSFGVPGNIDVYVCENGCPANAYGARTVCLSAGVARFIAEDIAKEKNLRLWYPWSQKNNIRYMDCEDKEIFQHHPFFTGRRFKSAFWKKYIVNANSINYRDLILAILAHEAGHLKNFDSASPLVSARIISNDKMRFGAKVMGLGALNGAALGLFQTKNKDAINCIIGGVTLGSMAAAATIFLATQYCRKIETAADEAVPNDPKLLFAIAEQFKEFDELDKKSLSPWEQFELRYFSGYPPFAARAARFQERLDALEKQK